MERSPLLFSVFDRSPEFGVPLQRPFSLLPSLRDLLDLPRFRATAVSTLLKIQGPTTYPFRNRNTLAVTGPGSFFFFFFFAPLLDYARGTFRSFKGSHPGLNGPVIITMTNPPLFFFFFFSRLTAISFWDVIRADLVRYVMLRAHLFVLVGVGLEPAGFFFFFDQPPPPLCSQGDDLLFWPADGPLLDPVKLSSPPPLLTKVPRVQRWRLFSLPLDLDFFFLLVFCMPPCPQL